MQQRPVLQYLDRLIVPNESVCNPGEERRVNIKVLPAIQPEGYDGAISPMSPNTLGFASSFYTPNSFYVGIEHPWTWKVINTGEYPNTASEEFYHALTRLNFEDVNWNTRYTDNSINGSSEHDLYTVVLHELTHAVGFVSAFINTSGELGNREGLGRYFDFDQNLQIDYNNSLPALDLIENGSPAEEQLFSPQWFFNDDVDGLGINDPGNPSDLHSGCPGTGPNILFKGLVADYPLYTGSSFDEGSSFSHLSGDCTSSAPEFVEFVMHPFLRPGKSRKLYQWQELDVLRTLGYNIDCETADFIDADSSDGLSFNCDQMDENCAIASVSDTRASLEACGVSAEILMIASCPGEHIARISEDALKSLLFWNDPNATGFAFIDPFFGESIGSFEKDNEDYVLTTQAWGNFTLAYAPLGCNGSVGNTSVFSITTFPGEDCQGVASCGPLTCEDFAVPADWPPCKNFNQCDENPCNLICNGGFCGTIAHINGIPDPGTFPYQTFGNASTPFNDLTSTILASPYSWIRGSGSADYIIPGSIENLPGMGFFHRDATSDTPEYLEGVFTYFQNVPEAGKDYLFSADFIREFSPFNDVANLLGLEVKLIQGQNYELCEIGDNLDQFCYDLTMPVQTVFDPSGSSFPDVSFPEVASLRAGNCLTIQNSFNALLVETISRGVGSYYQIIDNIELIPDNFSAGTNLTSQICGQSQTLGGEAFCMLSDVHVQYNWYEADSDEVIHTFSIINGVVTGNASFPVAPQRTTTYRLERTILDFGGLPDDFEFCTTSDEVTISVVEQLPIPDFTAELVGGECGVYNYFSDPSTVGNAHTWYLNEQTENAIFSTEPNPTGHMLPDGNNTIIHVVEGTCGIEVFEVDLPNVDCGNSSFACGCEGDNAINIDAGEAGTLLSELIASGDMPANGITNQCLAIKGQLLVDQAALGGGTFYQFNSSEVRMQPGAGITVEAGAALAVNFGFNEGGVHGCTALWKGISLASGAGGVNGGRLKLDGARIEDAVHAVTLSDKSAFEMRYTTLDGNHIGIYMPPSSVAQSVSQPTFPQLSSIKSTDDLLAPYEGQVVVTGSKSYAGVEINDSKFQIGGGNFGISIKQANYGVIARRSAVSIFSSSISNANPGLTDYDANIGVYAEENSWISLRDSRMFNLRTGVEGKNSSLYALNNNIGETPQGVRGNVIYGIALRMGVGNVASVTHQNKVYAQYFGVSTRSSHLANSILIQDNTVELYPPDAGIFNNAAIQLTGALMSGEDEAITVSRNDVSLHQSGHGIVLYNVNGTTIAENEVTFLSSFNQFKPRYGIQLHQGSDNYVYGNNINATVQAGFATGIYVFDGDRNALCCNTIEDTDYGVEFTGYCEETRLRHTFFKNNAIGLECSPFTRIGPQIAAGNIWDETDNNWPLPADQIWQARHLSFEEEDVSESLFFVAPPSGTSIWPDDVFVAAGNVNWFFPGPSAPSCEADLENCERPVLNRLAMDTDHTQKVLQGKFSYGDYAATSDWEAKRAFYRSQKATNAEERSDWSSSSSTFFGQQSQKKSSLYKLTTIDQALEESLREDSQMTTLVAKMNQLSGQILSLDQTIEEGESPTAAYLSSRAELLEQQAITFKNLSVRLHQREVAHTSLVAQLKQDNNSVSVLIEAAAAMKAVNTWYFETMAAGLDDLPSTAESALRAIAEKCPQRSGAAVGRAQSILVHYGKPFVSSNECKEDEKSGAKVSSPSLEDPTRLLKEALTAENIRVFPNPASGMLMVQIPPNVGLGEWKVELIDLKGRVLKYQVSQEGEIRVDLSEYAAGVYLIRVQSSQNSISKRVIIK